jgi:hypothetical protein
MAQKADRSDPASAAARMGEAQTEAMMAMQKDLVDAYEQISRAWLARAQSEAELWQELAAKVSGSRSVPDALRAYQQCVAQRMQMAADDGRRLLEDSQKIMGTVARSMSKGWPTAST